MDVLLAPIGTSGDILPSCALGRALAARGHRVAIAANPHFAAEIKPSGVQHIPVGDEAEYLALIAKPDWTDDKRGFPAIMRYVTRGIAPLYDVIAAHKPDKVVAHPFALAAGIAADKLGIEAITTYLSPAILQSEHLPSVLPFVPNGESYPRWYKRAVMWAADRIVFDGAAAPTVNRLRKKLGLRGKKSVFRDGWHDRRFLALFPEWFAPRQPDWPTHLAQVDFPALHVEATLPAEAAGFLDGDAIVFTPGTANRHAPRFFEAAIAAAAQLGRRAILLTRFAEQLPSPLPPHACWIRWTSLPSLLKHCAALVHHGGIGTMAAAFGAGVPQLVMPMSHDQPDNAARLERLGVGESLVPRRFAARAVAEALARLTGSPVVAARCEKIAGRMAGRNGLEDAADFIAGPGSALRRPIATAKPGAPAHHEDISSGHLLD